MDGTSASLRGSSSNDNFYVEGERFYWRTSEIKDVYEEYIASIEGSGSSGSHDQPTSQPPLIHSWQHTVGGDNNDGCFQRRTSQLMDEYQAYIASIEGSDSSSSHDQPHEVV